MSRARRSALVSKLAAVARRVIELLRRWNAALADRPIVSGALIATIALLLAAAGTAAVAFPEPTVHDEYSYLLGAETFAAGRLTNPRHPMAEHLRTFHVLSDPTYASKYPPAQALMLAAGLRLTGHAIAGVWLSFALMCVGVYWMLRVFIGPRWALVGAIGLALRLASSYWVYQYWGGSVAALGGALVLGGARRVVETSRARDASLMALGAALLANSRPYEGLLFCVPVAVVIGWWLVRNFRNHPRHALAVVVPCAIVLTVVGLAMLRYNHAVTGSATRFPYVAYLSEYGRGPDFLWQQPSAAPLSADTLVRRYQEWEMATADSLRSPGGFVTRNVDRVQTTVAFFLPIWLLAPVFVLPLALRSAWTRVAALCIGIVLMGLAVASWFQPHYAAPVTAPIILLYFACLAWCRRIRIGRFDAGLYLVALILTGWLASQVAKVAVPLARTGMAGVPPEWADWARRRADIERELRAEQGRDLAIVRYGPNHDFHHEWVRNGADIDGGEVVWAHDLGPEKNARLVDYFRDRKVWLVEVDNPPGTARRHAVPRRKPNE